MKRKTKVDPHPQWFQEMKATWEGAVGLDNAELDAVCNKANRQYAKILRTPARTPAGVAAQARTLLYGQQTECGGDAADERYTPRVARALERLMAGKGGAA